MAIDFDFGIAPLDGSARDTTAARLAALHGRSFARGWDAMVFQTLLDNANSIGFAALTRGGNGPLAAPPSEPAVVGLIYARHVLDEAEILTLAVDPAMRRQGIAASLLAALIDALAARAPMRLLLEVGVANQAARALYLSAGFCELSRRKRYYASGPGPAEDAVVMALEIAAGPHA